MKLKKLAAFAASLGIAASMAAALPMNASADDVYSTTIGGTKTTKFDKYLVMENDAVVPTASFSFAIEPGTAVPADPAKNTLDVFAGIGTPKFLTSTETSDEKKNDNVGDGTIATVNFTAADTVSSAVTIAEINKGEGKTVKFLTDSDKNDEKYAQKHIAIDFSGIVFPVPGVYRYVITESSAAADQASGVTNDTNDTRILDVVVIDSSSGGENTLSIDNFLLHDSDSDNPVKGTGESSGTATIANKSTGFTNRYETYDLTFSKSVDGNQGSRDKYFKFDINISNAKGADVTVEGKGTTFIAEPTQSSTTKYAPAVMKAANETDQDDSVTGQQLKADNNGAITATFYIRHGQSVKLTGIPAGAKYSVTEDAEGYTPTVSVTEAVASGHTADAAVNSDNNGITDVTTGIQGDVTAAFKNTQRGSIPTGVLVSTALPIAVIVVAAAGAIGCVIYFKKKSEDE